jgi:Family of unknown function (DUF6519)
MKADLSRQTFDPEKRYSGVLMQQGRVLLDSEWNEQQEIHQHRAESGAGDVIGPSGTPIDEDGKATGFEITAQDGKLYIGEGHIYVDGVLCVNDSEDPIPYDGQPNPPNPDDLTRWMDSESTEPESGDLKLGLVYLDVWERHITHLDDGRIREVALGGPDTTTRKQSVWQVKVMEIAPEQDDIELLTKYAELRAKSELNESEGEELSKVSPRAVKILGSLCKKGEESLDTLGEPPTGKLRARTKEPSGTTGPCQVPPGGGYERLENQLYRIEMHRRGNLATARFKWSRDNGCLATGIEDVDVGKKEITVKDTGRDEFLSFANGQWVEVVDDHTELQGRYRQLLQIDKPVDHARRVITVRQTPPAIDPELHPKLRRWDQNGEANENGLKLEKQELEDGIEVEFGSGEYRAGDYWLIPARTATGDIEWPRVDPEDPDSDPVAQSPHGVRHRFCALALVAAAQDESEDQLSVLHDCRNLFPPLTKLTSLFYLGGDGQEAIPGKELLEPLRVGVANGQWPVQGARVRFEILDSNGSLRSEDGSTSGETVTVLTDADGAAACRWTLDEDAKQQSQRVQATLLDIEDGTRHLPIRFSANLSLASQVAYDPTDCKFLAEASTVQEAIDQLCQRGGDTPEPGFHVEEVRRISDDAPVRNGSEMQVEEWMSGLRIVCDREVEPETIDPATCFVTLEMPWPLTDDERGFFGVEEIVGFQPLILRSTRASDGAMIFWIPDVKPNFIDRLRRLGDSTGRLLARLTLKGNFIRARKEPDVYLDGDTFGDPQDEFGIRRPTGDGRRGGDFEMYVWLI